jgi:hypothetical protein
MKTLLIVTTALVCVTSLAMAGSLPERQSGSGYGVTDTNEEFLCNYGFHLYISVSSSSYIEDWIRAATPVIGKGKPVSEIAVEDGPSAGRKHGGFQVAIYSSYRDKPNKELVAASATQQACGRVNVPISPITLQKGKKYWVVQTALVAPCCWGKNSIVWRYDRKRSHGALSQSGVCFASSSSCYSSHNAWKPIMGGVPYVRVRQSDEASQLNRPAQWQSAGDGSVSPAIVPKGRDGHAGGTPRYPP